MNRTVVGLDVFHAVSWRDYGTVMLCFVTVAYRGNVEMFSVETPGRCCSGAARL
jgi:hypothetical protein